MLDLHPFRAWPQGPLGFPMPDRAASALFPPLFRELRALAGNFWWSWQSDGPEVFRDISPSRWEASNHNPRRLLDETPLTRLTELDTDPRYRARARDLLTRFAAAMTAPAPWAESLKPRLAPERPVAYFSAEFAVHESLPIYAGGLGVLAADHLKSSSDLGLPLVGVAIDRGSSGLPRGLRGALALTSCSPSSSSPSSSSPSSR